MSERRFYADKLGRVWYWDKSQASGRDDCVSIDELVAQHFHAEPCAPAAAAPAEATGSPQAENRWPSVAAHAEAIERIAESEQPQPVGECGLMKLCDHADGCKDHFCVGRQIRRDEPYWEYWNDQSNKWSSAGTVYVGRPMAQSVMNWLGQKQDGDAH